MPCSASFSPGCNWRMAGRVSLEKRSATGRLLTALSLRLSLGDELVDRRGERRKLGWKLVNRIGGIRDPAINGVPSCLLDSGERLTYAIPRCVCGCQIQGHCGARVRGEPTADPFQ